TPLTLGNVTLTADTTLKSGNGAITVGSAAGSFNLSLQDNTAASLGLVTFNGNVTVGDLTTFNQNYGVRLLGANNVIDTA
ncbi:hypothetical protein, partial [Salmonella sp. SAL4457]|uniref:hypothetical protein n=1 Tax=Salmonella sp. SAL4457 TaxID=3159912 RepID=UPI00397B0F22